MDPKHDGLIEIFLLDKLICIDFMDRFFMRILEIQDILDTGVSGSECWW